VGLSLGVGQTGKGLGSAGIWAQPSLLLFCLPSFVFFLSLLGSGIFPQLFMLHEEIFPVAESFPDLVPFVDRLDFEGGDVLYGRDGQGAVLQQELDHFMALAQQSVVQGSVPFFIVFHLIRESSKV